MSGNIADPTLQALAAERGVVLLGKPFDLDQVEHRGRLVADGKDADGG